MTTQRALGALLAVLCGLPFAGPAPAGAQSVGARSFIQGEVARQGKADPARSVGARSAARESAAPIGRASRAGGSQREFVALLFGMRGDVSTTGALGGGHERPRILITPTPREGTAGGNRIAYCVRTCDGRFFPLSGRVSGPADAGAQAQCNAFCPAADVMVYASPDLAKGIEAAVDAQGAPYSALPNAFVFRQRLVEGCTCTPGGGPAGLARVEIKADVSLRRGDVVVTAAGARVFAGSRKGPPFRDADFAAPAALPDLPQDVRQRLEDLAFVTH